MADIIRDFANYVDFDKQSLLGTCPKLPKACDAIPANHDGSLDSVGCRYCI